MTKTARNEELRAAYDSGAPVADLMAIHGISRSRLYQIVNPGACTAQVARKKARNNAAN
jgi:hypothetical protein